ncbi:MAG: transposase [Flavobacterium sp.]|nr:MAG: transposase [Flavobacterium sp.]
MVSMKSLNQLFKPQAKYNHIKQQINGGVIIDPRLEEFRVEEPYIIAPDNRVVIPPNEIEATLQWLYENWEIHFIGAKGIKSLWQWIAREYINISRDDVKSFMSKKGLYQVVSEPVRDKGQKVIAKKPGDFFGVDLIDMSGVGPNNPRYRYILVCVDLYSRYTFTRALRNKTNLNNVSLSMDEILDESENDHGIKPKIVISDNGLEFKERFHSLLQQKHIKHLFTRSHSPNDNSVVERRNKEIRKILRSFSVHLNSNEWWRNLKQITKALNQTYTTRKK